MISKPSIADQLAAVLAAIVLLLGDTAALEWSQLPPLPDEHGFAGAFAGLVDGFLVVAGGANFPDGYPWDDGIKAWHDSVFVLDAPNGKWEKSALRLPRPIAYGVSITTSDGCFFIGGQDGESSYASTFGISRPGGLEVLPALLPELPTATSMACGALVGEFIYVAGGSPDAGQSAQKTFYRIKPHAFGDWEELPWPEDAPGRILAIAGSAEGKFYLFGGADLGSEHWDRRRYLDDAYEFDPDSMSWRRLSDLPRQMTAGPTPAIPNSSSELVLVGGASREFVDAQRALRPATNGNGLDHPGFPKHVFAYNIVTDTWRELGEVPEGIWSPVTTPTLSWHGQTVIPSGEIKPGIRSPQVIAVTTPGASGSFGWINWTVIAAYLGGMLLVGYWFSKRNRSTDDYFRGGQRVPSWVAGLSIFATMLSAITFMAIPARAYATDVTWYIGQLPILIVIPLVIVFYLPYFRRLDITSAYEFLEHRFNLPARLFASLSFILFHIGRIAIVLYLPAIALAQVSSINVLTCILIIGILCVIYTVMGGIEAVVWTDAIQAIVLLGGALLCLLLVFLKIEGGVASVWQISVDNGKLFSNLSTDFNLSDGTTSIFILFTAFLFNALVPYTSGQDVVQRYVTTPTEKDAARSLKTTMWMSIFGSMIFFALGLALFAFYDTKPGLLDPDMSTADAILPFFILQQLPVGIAGLIIAAIFAAAQSTVSSSLNSVATAYVTDFHSRVFRPDNSDRCNLRVARIAIILLGIVGISVACIMAKSEMESAFKTFNTLIGLTAGSLGGLFALGVFNRHANGSGAVLGALLGFATVLGLHFAEAPITGLLYAAIGFITCFVAGTLLSLAFPGDKPKRP